MAITVVYVTFPDEGTALNTGDQVLAKRLAACVNIFPMQSAYWWQDSIQKETEWVGLFKTRAELLPDLESFIGSNHPYQLPCIMRWEVEANTEYESWIFEQTV